MFGRFIEQDNRTGSGAESLVAADFYSFDLDLQNWTLVSPDVRAEGGPALVYDHQMVVDEVADLIYLFGGRIIAPPSNSTEEPRYSGLYVYDIGSNQWKCLRQDSVDHQPTHSPALRSRIGHSMVFNQSENRLYILAGQLNKDYLADYYVYDVPTDTVIEWVKDTSRVGGPDPGFTQRSTLDQELGELYLFTGLMRDKQLLSSPNSTAVSAGEPISKNSFWVYKLGRSKWTKLDVMEAEDGASWPCARFAHQFVYDPVQKQHYLFGGNPGEPSAPKRRLNDLWRLRLVRQLESSDILRRARFLLRRQRYYELCIGWNGASSLEALKYLQNDVCQCVKHEVDEESEEFRRLSGWLFQQPHSSTNAGSSQAAVAGGASGFLSPQSKSPILGVQSYLADPTEQVRISRVQLFNDLTGFLPKSTRPPQTNLIDLVHHQD